MEMVSLHPVPLYHVSGGLKMPCRKLCHSRTSCKCFQVVERFGEKGQDEQREVRRERKENEIIKCRELSTKLIFGPSVPKEVEKQ